ncbi:hypothetical protein SAMN05421721_11729 [Ectothiorhodospira mobilis]|uniref:Uncharacterized protein n=1 Tax=Ectothiorhodospira mobilis TaxID=195064 RepID=A0A1I4SIR4_ECTMO|nr:hypothetical protein [Ectothiorhodospira mobilis]SFM64304.1 hypothetical protein SAMN05421721_11729 [Ectothiorhodospira mobilis]
MSAAPGLILTVDLLHARWAAHPLAAQLHRQIQQRRARRALQGMEDHQELLSAPSTRQYL